MEVFIAKAEIKNTDFGKVLYVQVTVGNSGD